LEEARDGRRLNPNYAIAIHNLCTALLRFNRLAEIKENCRDAFQREMDGDLFHVLLYQTAFIEHDEAAMEEHLAWFHGRDDEHIAINQTAAAAAFGGKWRASQELTKRSIELAVRNDAVESAAEYAAEQAVRMVCWSSPTLIPARDDQKLKLPLQTQVKRALQFSRNKVALSRVAVALDFAGHRAEADTLFQEIRSEYPNNTLLNQLWMPFAKAGGLLHSGRYEAAVAALEMTERFQGAGQFFPQYFRGLSYLNLNRKNDAVREFDSILTHQGEAPLSAIYPLAQLAKARALNDKREYEKFFEFWKDADADMPALVAAESEYEALV
jgi:tetratricopeptide (TPR) repeat protein